MFRFAPESSKARCCKTFNGSSTCGTEKAGTPGCGYLALEFDRHTLNIPDFSNAISPSVLPSTSMWSKPIDVMPVTTGLSMTFVTSVLPPMPVSTTATSTFSSTNTRKATRVKNLKKLGLDLPAFSKASQHSQNLATKRS
eukprot:TRINITY_DN5187_c0_g1_i2.p2 TRINITY_DN5187_c0_g1~~TRINITY_DN5187_c0_g1_i2.p2  ORF type:complete len:140 (-),score=19.06 TRINITY_DN5187_c0_g1_i2:602-1021(-)